MAAGNVPGILRRGRPHRRTTGMDPPPERTIHCRYRRGGHLRPMDGLLSLHGIPMRLIQSTNQKKASCSSAPQVHLIMWRKWRREARLRYQEMKFPFTKVPACRSFRPWFSGRPAEWDLAAGNKLDEIIRLEDLRGVVHNHSTWSDGGIRFGRWQKPA